MTPPLPSARTLRAVVAALVAVAGSLHAQRAPHADFGSAWGTVRDFFHQTLTAEGVVGGSIAFFHGDTVLAREYHGFADLATQRRVDDRTIYHWASITKTLTAISLMQLRDRGRLTLDDPVVRSVPELSLVHNPFGKMDAITFRQLLSHSGGFRNGTWPWSDGQPWQPFEPTQWAQLVAMLPYTEVLFAPGSRYSYSNPGYIYVGRAIERITGEDYEVYVEKNVLRPLGMSSSYFDITPYHLLADRSNNYYLLNGAAKAQGLDFDTGITVSNGGLNAPIGDMIRYLQFLVAAPGVTPAGRGVLARTSLDEMMRPVLPIDGTDRDSIGLGFFHIERNGVSLVGHTGSQAAFRAFFYLDPATKAGVIAVFNTAPPETADNATTLVAAKPRIDVIFDGLRDRLTRGVFPLFRRP